MLHAGNGNEAAERILEPVKCVWIWQVGAGFCMQIEVVSPHFIRANEGFEYVQLDISFKSAWDGGEWSVLHAGRSTAGQRAPNEQGFVWTPGPSCTSSSGGKSLAPAGILPWKKIRGGERGIGPLFLNVGTRWCERSNSLPSPLFPAKVSAVLITEKAGWIPGSVWTVLEKWKSLASVWIRAPNRRARS